MVNQIKKGKTFEREIAKLLTLVTGVKWQRVPMSGAFATNNKSDDPRFSGDVFTEDEKYNNYVIECKSYAKLDVNDLFLEKSNFYKWVKQCEEESKNKEWLLFIKAKNKGIYLYVSSYNKLTKKFLFGRRFFMLNNRMFTKLK